MVVVVLSLVLASLTECAPKSPRIYNVLISTKKNLAPSQALPVYEPVLRTTSVGLAFSPLIYTPISTIHTSPSRYVSFYIRSEPKVLHKVLRFQKGDLFEALGFELHAICVL